MVPQEPYHKAEDHFLSELTAYTKKQFFQVSMNQVSWGLGMRLNPLTIWYTRWLVGLASFPDSCFIQLLEKTWNEAKLDFGSILLPKPNILFGNHYVWYRILPNLDAPVSELICITEYRWYTVHSFTSLSPSFSVSVPQGIAVLASSPDTTQCGVLDLGDEQNVLLRGMMTGHLAP